MIIIKPCFAKCNNINVVFIYVVLEFNNFATYALAVPGQNFKRLVIMGH